MISTASLSMRRLSLLFLLIFAALVAVLLVYQRYWGAPGDRCEENGGWWDRSSRTCGRVVYLPEITGRQPGESRADASMRAAADAAEADHALAVEAAAREADRRRQEAVLETATPD